MISLDFSLSFFFHVELHDSMLNVFCFMFFPPESFTDVSAVPVMTAQTIQVTGWYSFNYVSLHPH